MRFPLLMMITLPPLAGTDSAESLLEAVRKGDATAVRSLLTAGVPADTKYRYERTALSFAADRGHLEITRLLIDHGADVNAKDTFYGATPLDLALHHKHVDVVGLLLERGARGENTLRAGVEAGDLTLVQLALDKTKPTPEALSAALTVATKAGHDPVAERLRLAGAAPLPPASFRVAPETLAGYAGRYLCADGNEVALAVQDGGLACTTCARTPLALGAMSDLTFRPMEFNGLTIEFKLEGPRVAGLTLRDWGQPTECARAEGTGP
jgi:hypothetical protein